jgi:hypothetical protein
LLKELLLSLGRHIMHLDVRTRARQDAPVDRRTLPSPHRPHIRLGNLAIEAPTISVFEPDLLHGVPAGSAASAPARCPAPTHAFLSHAPGPTTNAEEG